MEFGLRGHDIKTSDFRDLTRRFKNSQLNVMQLVLKKTFINSNIQEELQREDFINHINEELQKNNVRVGVLGCYFNMGHPDDRELQEMIEGFKAQIRFGKRINCGVVGTETGAINKEYVYEEGNHSEEAYQRCLSTLKEMVKEAEKEKQYIAIEGVWSHIIHTPEVMKRVLEDINSEYLKVILDPCNLLNGSNYEKREEIIVKVFELYGDKICAIHLKDFIVENNEVKEVPIGTGIFRYKTLFNLLEKYNCNADLIFEGTEEQDIVRSIEYIKKAIG
ncbi:MAG: sugar phosphate isomerase/epimerase family protein [Clostridium sp.]|nr:sugar phosphate isomerase/epimerase family protein [Clostridium sp.]MDU7083031.1 sugar phosphate isomerase/epimerase family protein [Clostridium sp.]